jgi:hypothetical protein
VKKKNDIQVSTGRFIFGILTLAALSTALVALVRTGNLTAAIIAGPLFTIPLISLGEWLVHGVLYHGHVPGLEFIRTIHHAGHHFALFPPKHYVQHGPYEFMRFRKPFKPFVMSDNPVDNWLTKWSQIGLHFVVGIPLILTPAWFATSSVAFIVSCTVTLAVVSWLLAYVHGVIHTPGDRLIEHMRWFQWLDRHHYIHHIDLGANINFLLPLCDLLFGTQKAALTAEEAAKHPSFEESKPMAKDIPVRAAEAA